MKKINLETAIGNSEIWIETGLTNHLENILSERYHNVRFVVITDDNVKKIFPGIFNALEKNGQNLILSIKPGEGQKNITTVTELAGHMLDNEITRHDVVIAIGGGMVTDLAGFLASIYMRGMKWIAIPTTLLAMTDAAIGGKTGVDFKAKNILGTTYLPQLVLVDTKIADDLPREEKKNAMGEIIKYAAIIDPELLEEFGKIPLNLPKIIERCAQAKVDVTSEDLHEGGRRKILNFGHTFGHAIEEHTKYQYSHGEAISIGMMIANRVAQKLEKQTPETGKLLETHFQKFGLPTQLPKEINISDLMPYILNDKKRKGEMIDFVIIQEMGIAEIIPLTPEKLQQLAD